MCKWGNTKDVMVYIPEDLSSTGQAKTAHKPIDECIAPIVDALNKHGVLTRSSCCGHGKREGNIILQDGRILLILSKEQGEKYITNRGKNSNINEWIHFL